MPDAWNDLPRPLRNRLTIERCVEVERTATSRRWLLLVPDWPRITYGPAQPEAPAPLPESQANAGEPLDALALAARRSEAGAWELLVPELRRLARIRLRRCRELDRLEPVSVREGRVDRLVLAAWPVVMKRWKPERAPLRVWLLGRKQFGWNNAVRREVAAERRLEPKVEDAFQTPKPKAPRQRKPKNSSELPDKVYQRLVLACRASMVTRLEGHPHHALAVAFLREGIPPKSWAASCGWTGKNPEAVYRRVRRALGELRERARATARDEGLFRPEIIDDAFPERAPAAEVRRPGDWRVELTAFAQERQEFEAQASFEAEVRHATQTNRSGFHGGGSLKGSGAWDR